MVKKQDFVNKLLDLWMTTAIPLSAANIQYYTGSNRSQQNQWLQEMLADGIVELDSDDNGELLWLVPGANRPATPTSFAEANTLNNKRKKHSGEAIINIAQQTNWQKLREELTGEAKSNLRKDLRKNLGNKGTKSVALSGALSLLGPCGWLYAGSWREAIPASIAYLVALQIIPTFLLIPLLVVGLPISGLLGATYAAKHNHQGERQRLLSPPKSP